MSDKLALLNWYNDMGVEQLTEDKTRNLFAKPTPPPSPSPSPSPSPIPAPASSPTSNIVHHMTNTQAETRNPKLTPPSEAILASRELADKCTTLEELRAAIEGFDGLAIKHTATNTVFSDGTSTADVMLMGEAPGANEDEQGIPFCGVSGKLLDRMFYRIGYTRKESLYISNSVFWRPPGNRKPTPEEIAICLPFVEKHLALIKPKLLVLVGATAVASVLESKQSVSKLRGNFFTYTNRYLDGDIDVSVIYHPAYLLRQPSQKRLMWQDLLKIKGFLNAAA